MQKNRKIVLFTFHLIMFLILLIFQLNKVFFSISLTYSTNYTVPII